MRAYLLAVSGIATAIVLYAPLAGSDPKPAPPAGPRYGIAAHWDGSAFDTPGVISCHGRTLSIVVEPSRLLVGDSISNEVTTFSGHNWMRVRELLALRVAEGEANDGDWISRIEIATRGTAEQPITYQALVTAMVTAEAAGVGDRTVIVDASEVLTPM